MSLPELFDRIESKVFSNELNLANSLRAFTDLLGARPEVRALVREALSAEIAWLVIRRMNALVKQPPESGFEHEADCALAAYVFALRKAGSPLADLANSFAAHTTGAWWAKRVAVLANPQPRSNSSVQVATTPGTVQVANTARDAPGVWPIALAASVTIAIWAGGAHVVATRRHDETAIVKWKAKASISASASGEPAALEHVPWPT